MSEPVLGGWLLDTLPAPLMRPCLGPMIWYEMNARWHTCANCGPGHRHTTVFLECAVCGELFAGFIDKAHAFTDIVKESEYRL